MKDEKVLLIYGFNLDEQLKLTEVLKANSLPLYKVITDSEVQLTLEDVLNKKEIGIAETKSGDEKVVLFNGCSDDEVKIAMRTIKDICIKKPIFAMVTPTSIHWKFNYLIEHLMEERSKFEKNS